MGKQNKSYAGRFRHIHTYSEIPGMFKNQACSEIIQAYSGIFRTLAYPEPCQTSPMESFAKIVNSWSFYHKLKLFLQYQFFILSTFLNKSLFFTPEAFILCKKV